MINRRKFVRQGILGTGAMMLGMSSLYADARSDLKITKISHYKDPNYKKPTFNQATDIVVVEVSDGTIGIGEGGSTEMIQQCAELLIGEDPFRIEHLWQKVYRGYFYPAGREKLHALGALDMALWDIKAKSLNVPLYELFGGLTRDYVQCYSTGFPRQGSLKETASACMEAGFYAYRMGTASSGDIFDPHKWIDATYEACREVKEGVGEKGQWAIDLHTRFDFAEAVAMCRLLEPLKPVFVEDLIRSENPGVYKTLRNQVKVPIAVGEHFGDRWDVNELIEQQLIDHSRITLPNCGGITEFMKIAAICETHYVGLIPHFTGPISTAALVHTLGALSGFAMSEMRGAGPASHDYLNDDYVLFKNGKLYPNDKPGLGVEFLPKKAKLVNVISKKPEFDHPMFRRSDGSITNW
ncbi:mandelate racemase/muconate lactonizing enzyme family protein [Agaribacillus aureus]|uniref:mandelate racemase/muconate lactonizing enzyme family protein n=1 Tax=Agaribacillus aureus TaxID=3051825 RepID=UPI003211A0A6